MALRDIRQRLASRLGHKQNITLKKRAVIVASDGSRTTGSPFADEDSKLVYVQFFGSGGIGKARCEKIVAQLGLGVQVVSDDSGQTWYVESDDLFLRQTSTDNRNYQTTSARDLQPGGIRMMWLQSKALQPLATRPQATGLLVDVISGYYPYAGVRTFFAGQTSVAITQNPNPGEHYFAGLYLDSADALQVVYGASVVLATNPPPEPSWPDGAFQLSVVRINDTQTSVVFSLDNDTANDVFDRRMLWADIDSFGGGWPFANVKTVSTTDPDADYATIAAANIAGNAGKIILLDKEPFAENVTLLALTLKSWSFTSLASIAGTVVMSTSGGILEDISVFASGVGTAAVTASSTVQTLNGVSVTHSGVVDARGIVSSATNLTIIRCSVTASGSSTGYGVRITAGTVTVDEMTRFNGSTADLRVEGGTVRLRGCTLANATISQTGGTITGWYKDNTGNIHLAPGSNFIDLEGIADALILDADADTTISAPTDDQIDFEAGGVDAATLTAAGLALASGIRANELSNDGTLASESQTALPTEYAVNQALPLGVAEGRLTLQSFVPVPATDQTAKTTIYFTPYHGNRIRLYNGTSWIVRVIGELSLSLSGFTADKNNDVFVYDNAGTVTLERVEWTNDTTRATAIVLQDGMYVKDGDATRLYVGTFRTSATGQCEDSEAKRFVWNYYNRRRRTLSREETTGSWSYSTTDWRYQNNSSANRVDFVVGVAEDSVEARLLGSFSGNGSMAMHLDSATPTTPDSLIAYSNTTTVSSIGTFYEEIVAAGFHFLAIIEWAAAATTFYGRETLDSDRYIQTGLRGNLWG